MRPPATEPPTIDHIPVVFNTVSALFGAVVDQLPSLSRIKTDTVDRTGSPTNYLGRFCPLRLITAMMTDWDRKCIAIEYDVAVMMAWIT